MQVILGSFYVHLGFRISAYMAVNSNPALQPDVVGHPEVFMCLKCTRLWRIPMDFLMISINFLAPSPDS